MNTREPVTVTLNADSFNGPPMFRRYEIIVVRGSKHKVYNMVTEDARPTIANSCTISLRRLNTSKWNWIAKIQIKIFKALLQQPPQDKP